MADNLEKNLKATDQQAGTSTINSFSEYESFLADLEEESQFQKHGGKILAMLKQELNLMKLKKEKRSTLLHEHQIEAVLKTAQHFHLENEEKDRPALITAPPGSGKSGMIVLLPYVLLSKKVMIVTPSKVISYQIAQELGVPNANNAFFLKSGILKTSKAWKTLMEVPWIPQNPEEVNTMTRKNLVIINIQKLFGNTTTNLNSNNEMKENLNEFDTIIVDESHHHSYKTWQNILDCFRGKKLIFLTATPFLKFDNKLVHLAESSIGLNLDEVYNIKREYLEGVTIRKLEFFEKHSPFDFNGINLPEYINQLGEDIQDIFARHKQMEPRLKNPQAIVAVRTKNEAMQVARGLGKSATFIFSGKEGVENLSNFAKGNKQIAVVCRMLTEGYDNSDVTLCVILKKVHSRVIFEQFCGRCMRINRILPGNTIDKTIGTILTYENFQQQKMWDARTIIANEDQSDDDDEESDKD